MIEIYKGFHKKEKTYVVATKKSEYPALVPYAARLLKVSKEHIYFTEGWLLDKQLYLDNPHNSKAKRVGVAFYVR